MIALLTYPAIRPALSTSSSGVHERARAATFSHEVWELHHVIANPVSRANDVKIAKQQLLRQLRKSQPAQVIRELRRLRRSSSTNH
jgi:hypothetical protein